MSYYRTSRVTRPAACGAIFVLLPAATWRWRFTMSWQPSNRSRDLIGNTVAKRRPL